MVGTRFVSSARRFHSQHIHFLLTREIGGAEPSISRGGGSRLRSPWTAEAVVISRFREYLSAQSRKPWCLLLNCCVQYINMFFEYSKQALILTRAVLCINLRISGRILQDDDLIHFSFLIFRQVASRSRYIPVYVGRYR